MPGPTSPDLIASLSTLAIRCQRWNRPPPATDRSGNRLCSTNARPLTQDGSPHRRSLAYKASGNGP